MKRKIQKMLVASLAGVLVWAAAAGEGGELLRTVSVREWNELLILGAVILLRAALTFLIHWEIGLETKKVLPPAPSDSVGKKSGKG